MPFIKGIDAEGKTHWLTADGYWGELSHRCNFSPARASELKREFRQMNLYIDPEDRITPEIHS